MGKSVLSAQELLGKKKENTIKRDKSSNIFLVETLVDEDTTNWIVKDEQIDLDRLIAESKTVR
jgi:hypothetical protein